MATGFDIFGETIRDWLEEPDNDEAEPVSLLLAASDDYESSQDPAKQPSCRPLPLPLCSCKERWQRMAKRALATGMDASCSCHFQLQRN